VLTVTSGIFFFLRRVFVCRNTDEKSGDFTFLESMLRLQ